MGTADKKPKVTVQEYLDYLDSIEGRAEFYDGVIYDMAGSSDEHALIGMNFGTALNVALGDRPCRVYGADGNLAIDADNSIVMPDIHVVCGDNEPSSQNSKLHSNAILVVEILSKSTESYDRAKKFDRYKMLRSLREYVLVQQDERRIEVYLLNHNGKWEQTVYHGQDGAITLASIQVTIPIMAIYKNVQFLEIEE